MTDEQKKDVFGELSVLTPKTAEYRAKRLELAIKYVRTEGSIEQIFSSRLKALAKDRVKQSDLPPAA